MKKIKKTKNPMIQLMQLINHTDFGSLSSAVEDRMEDYVQWCQRYEDEDGYPKGFGERLAQAVSFLNQMEEFQAILQQSAIPPQLDDDGYFAIIRWHEEDIKQALTTQGYLANKANVQKVLASRTGKTLQERSVEEGWTILEDCLCFVDGLQMRKNRKS